MPGMGRHTAHAGLGEARPALPQDTRHTGDIPRQGGDRPMSVFPETRAAATYVAGTGPGLHDVVLAVRDLAGPAWLDANGDDPDAAAFTHPELR
jgi:hypothetical protein